MAQWVLPVEGRQTESGQFFVQCLLLPGCHAEGATLAEALESLQDAAHLVLSYMREQHIPLPAGIRPASGATLHEELLVDVAS